MRGSGVFFLALCLFAVCVHAAAGGSAPGKEALRSARISPHEVLRASHGAVEGGPRWEEALLWRVQGEGEPWACPWCGKKDNVHGAARCAGCGYLECNPGGYLLHPVDAVLVTNGYSPGHRGVDFGAAEGSFVYAAEDGIVVEARTDRWEGNVVRISHDGGVETLYAHLGEVGAAPGSYVRRGEIIALSGSTGVSTGPHLHFEVIMQGVQVDPLPHLAP